MSEPQPTLMPSAGGPTRYLGIDKADYRRNPEHRRLELLSIIERAQRMHERSQQTALGPSEIGIPCARRLGYALLGAEERGSDLNDGWKATIGTAVHAWLEKALAIDDLHWSKVSAPRWEAEGTFDAGVTIGSTPLTGHVDVYDMALGAITDWKVVGSKQLAKYRMNGPGEQYRIQVHTYGYLVQHSGHPVDLVSILFLPRDGRLRDAVYWQEDYDESIALQALARVNGIATAVQMLGTAALDVLDAADHYCHFCPYFNPDATALAAGCPGAEGTTRRGFTGAAVHVQELSLDELLAS